MVTMMDQAETRVLLNEMGKNPQKPQNKPMLLPDDLSTQDPAPLTPDAWGFLHPRSKSPVDTQSPTV
jgi:hypothetical protein